MSKSLNDILASFSGDKSEIISILQDIQSNMGYLPEQAIIGGFKIHRSS